MALPGVRGASGVRGAGGVDEQEGIPPARALVGRSVWPSACRGAAEQARRFPRDTSDAYDAILRKFHI